jgi:hypothetical protein
LLALAFEGAFGEHDLLGEIRGDGGQQWTILAAAWRSRRRGSSLLGSRPDEDPALLIHGQALAVDKLVLEIVQGRIVELKLPLEGPIRQAAPLVQQGDHLI